MTEKSLSFQNISLREDGAAVVILDQSLLPNETKYLELSGADELFEAIRSLRVRGAPAIGIFAAFALYVLARKYSSLNVSGFLSELECQAAFLSSSRPTAVNLNRMLRRMTDLARSMSGEPVFVILNALRCEAERIQLEDAEMCRKISENALTLVRDGDCVLTHCNAGPLATSRYGTGLGPFFLGLERGVRLRAFCCETRPLLQGARLTSYELSRAGVDCTLICDNMAASVMQKGLINACFVGCDRVAANGDTANKIGTLGLAILARHYGVPFYILGPSTTIDLACPDGDSIPIELRGGDEIKSLYFSAPTAPPEVKCYNPAFDVTDNSLITAIITERGIAKAPYAENLQRLFG